MSSASKRKGSMYENQLEQWFIDNGYDTQRLRLSGKDDQGDLHTRLNDKSYLVWEAKARKQLNLAEWVREADLEAANHEVKRKVESWPVVVHKKRMASIGESYVTMPLATFMEFLRAKGVV